MSAPSIARARPHVIGSTCRLAGVMPAPNPHSDRPGFDRLDRSCHECRLTSDAAHLLVSAVVVTFSLRYVRASCMLSLSSCPDHVSKQLEAPWHVSSDAHSSCVPSATVCLLVWLTWTNVVSRARQLRSARLPRIWAAALGWPVGSVAEKLGDSKLAMRFACRGWPLSVDSRCVRKTMTVWSNVDARPFPAIGSRIYPPSTRPVGIMMSSDREGPW